MDRETERIDYDALEAQAEAVRPKVLVAGASAYPRTWDFERMADIAQRNQNLAEQKQMSGVDSCGEKAGTRSRRFAGGKRLAWHRRHQATKASAVVKLRQEAAVTTARTD